MAIQSREIFSSDDNGDPNHHKTVTIFWDDVPNAQGDMPLTAVEIDNRFGIYALPCKATVDKNGRTFEKTVLPGEPIFHQDLPTTGNRLEIFINPDNGRLDGVTYQIG